MSKEGWAVKEAVSQGSREGEGAELWRRQGL